ncbi:MAG: hypothetical protein V4501_12435 [Pseudomonadota bacterium]
MEPVSQSALTLDEQEKEILTKTGIPPVFAIFLKQKSSQFGMAFALRTSPPVQRYLMPAAPKPVAVKAKTGNWSFTKGVIAVEPDLGKVEKVNGHWQVTQRSLRDFPDPKLGILNEVLHRISLQEVLSGIAGGEYKLIGTEQDIQDAGVITLQAARKNPEQSDIIFSIDLNEKPPRVESQCKIDFAKMLMSPPTKAARPSWWLDEWGDFANCLDNYYPAQYKHASDINFMDIMVYGIDDGDHHILPITADQDLLWISIPAKQHDELWKDFEEVINTFEQDGVEKLYLARVELYLRLGGDPGAVESSIRNETIAGLGSVTPYESYVIDAINKDFSQSGIKHIRNLIQHASENHNPDPEHLAPLDVSMVHVWRGKVSMTHTEKELISFILQDDYPKENIINIHPKWDMAKWSAVVHTQIDLHQPIPANTLAAYRIYRQKNKGFANLLQWVQKKDEV